jgi:hypothetical protein
MVLTSPPPERGLSRPATDPEGRGSHLRARLDAADRDNSRLQKQLAAVLTENRRLRNGPSPRAQTHPSHQARLREALSEPWSRNP